VFHLRRAGLRARVTGLRGRLALGLGIHLGTQQDRGAG
jgi:hypothetical protein